MTETVFNIDQICDKASELKSQINELEDKADGLKNELRNYERQLLAFFETSGKDRCGSTMGDISVRERLSVKTPKSESDKRALFDWLNKRGIFFEFASVNSNSLNALYKQEVEAAQLENRECDMPVGEPEIFKQLIIKPRK